MNHSRKLYRRYGTVKSESVLSRIHGLPRNREDREFIAFAEWHRSRFRENFILKPESRRLIAAYRCYLRLGLMEQMKEGK